MRSSNVVVPPVAKWALSLLLLLLAPGTHERLVLVFAFPMVFFVFYGERERRGKNSEEIQI